MGPGDFAGYIMVIQVPQFRDRVTTLRQVDRFLISANLHQELRTEEI